MWIYLLLYVGALDDSEISLRPTDALGLENFDSIIDSEYYCDGHCDFETRYRRLFRNVKLEVANCDIKLVVIVKANKETSVAFCDTLEKNKWSQIATTLKRLRFLSTPNRFFMKEIIIPNEVITNKIYFIRNQKVMLDRDLALLYAVETKKINQQVKRNISRFPENFMFQLDETEYENLKSQIVTSSWGGTRKSPYVFTEHGILQLANVLRSERATQVSIKIIEIFVSLRELLTDRLNVKLELEQIKKKLVNHDKNIELVFSYLDELIEKREDKTERTKIGYKN